MFKALTFWMKHYYCSCTITTIILKKYTTQPNDYEVAQDIVIIQKANPGFGDTGEQ